LSSPLPRLQYHLSLCPTNILTELSTRTARNSRPLEVIGTYDPIPKPDPYDNSGKLHKDIKLDSQRAKYWIGVGAQPTDTAWRLLSMVGILPKKHFAPKESETKGSVNAGDVKIR
jgi:small subunit ribosomal protein S16